MSTRCFAAKLRMAGAGGGSSAAWRSSSHWRSWPSPARAQEPVRIGMGFGLAFLPIFLCEDLKLIEKHGKDAHLNLKASYQRFLGAGPLQDALAAGAIDVAPFGVAPLLAAWEKGKGSPRQILAVAGLSTLPLTLLTNRADVRSLADFRPTDRIAVPTRVLAASSICCGCSRRRSSASMTGCRARS